MELGNESNSQPEVIDSKPKSGWGGARPNSGRPKGSTNKITAADLLDQLQLTLGKPYLAQLAHNYLEAIIEGDKALVHKYDQIFSGKLMADRVDLTSQGEKMREIIEITYIKDENKTQG